MRTKKEPDLPLLFSQIRKTGLLAETAMFDAAGGVNTHKGIIFSMGILAASAGFLFGQSRLNLPSLNLSELLSLAGKLCRKEIQEDFSALEQRRQQADAKSGTGNVHFSHGEKLYLAYGCRGIRGEPPTDFPLCPLFPWQLSPQPLRPLAEKQRFPEISGTEPAFRLSSPSWPRWRTPM